MALITCGLLLLPLWTVCAQDHTDNRLVVSKEYCTYEVFEPSCPPQHIILIQSALYGRMNPGRCISAGYDNDCKDDVTNILDAKCSGRNNCSMMVGVFDSIAQPCKKDLKSYLQVTYECVEVSTIGPCLMDNIRTLFARHSGYLSFPLGLAASIQTNCPLLISTDSGRRLNFTFFKINTAQAGTDDRPVSSCDIDLIFIEEDIGVRESVSMCQAQTLQKNDVIYSTRSSTVRIEFRIGRNHKLTLPSTTTAMSSLLISYTVYGCEDIAPPEGATVRRDKDNMAVICNQTQETWYLTCRRNTWIGDFGNCTSKAHDLNKSPTNKMTNSKKEFHNGIVIAVLIGVVLGVIVGACMLCFIFVIRRSRNRNRPSRPGTEEEHYETRIRNGDSTGSNNYPTLLGHEKTCTGPGCDYEHMWNTFPPPPPHLCPNNEGNYSIDTRFPHPPPNLVDNSLCPFKDCEFERINLTHLKSQPDCIAQTVDSRGCNRDKEVKLGNGAKLGGKRPEEVHVIIRDSPNRT